MVSAEVYGFRLRLLYGFRTDEHTALWPISKATAHTKACAALRRANMEQGISESEGRHMEEEEVGGKAAASGL